MEPQGPPLAPWLRSLLAVAAFWTLCAAVAVHVPWLWPEAAFVVGFGSVSAFVLVAAATVPLRRASHWMLLGAVALLIAIYYAEGLGVPAGRVPASATALLVLLGLLIVGSVVGASVGVRVEHPGQLLFLAPIAAAADVLSVVHPKGVSAAILSDERTLSVLALPFPLLGTDAIVPLLGVGDVVFVALYVAVSRRHQLPVWRTLFALAGAFAATAAWVLWTQRVTPALPMLGLAMLVVHPAARQPRAQDRLPGALGLVLAAGAVAWLLWPSLVGGAGV